MNIRTANESDAHLLWNLAQKCPPLDIHTPYTYWVMCHFFSECIFILEEHNEAIGFCMNLCTHDTLFVWQIGILEEYRGQNNSQLLLKMVNDYAISNGIKQIQVSISEDNKNSFYAFEQFCNKNKITMDKIGIVNLDFPEAAFIEVENLYKLTRE